MFGCRVCSGIVSVLSVSKAQLCFLTACVEDFSDEASPMITKVCTPTYVACEILSRKVGMRRKCIS
eukprot:781037-Amphidinium_carterae.2